MVGFATLANTISRPGMSVSDLKLNKLRIILTTEMGIVLICLCVLPLLFSVSDFEEATVFRVLSLAVFLFAVPYSIFMPLRVKGWTGKMLPTGVAKFYHLTNILFMTGPLLINSLGIFPDYLVLIYCGVIFVLFTLLCTLFCRLLYTVLPTISQD